eukprot:sb/3462962/
MDVFDSFFKANERKCVVIFHPEAPTPTETERVGSGKSSIPKPFIVTADSSGKLNGEGQIVYMTRVTGKGCTQSNVDSEVLFGVYYVNEGQSPITVAQELLGSLFTPYLHEFELESKQCSNGEELKRDFEITVQEFDKALSDAKSCLNVTVELVKPDTLQNLNGPPNKDKWHELACDKKTLAAVEGMIQAWCRRIELVCVNNGRVLIESDLIQKESDDIGPYAELASWKLRQAKFNYLLEQIQSPLCRNACGILRNAKSKLLETWIKFDQKITDAANESRDNVRILEKLFELCKPLYYSDPMGIKPNIKKIMESILLIYTTSKYYNTTDCMTHLFVKITNQMVVSCKDYITEKGVKRIWDFEYDDVMVKIQNAIELYKEYDRSFQFMKSKSEKEFDFSEMYTFGKFVAFCKRLENIQRMLNIIERFKALQTIKLEGFESIITKYKVIVSTMQKKGYDFLDQRKATFDEDFEYFLSQITQLANGVMTYAETQINKCTSVTRCLEILGKLDRLNISELKFSNHYAIAVDKYQIELERIKQTNDVHKKLIKKFNKMAGCLINYELKHTEAYYQVYEIIKTSLKASVLVKHPETGQLFINFDPSFIELLRETVLFKKLGIELPEASDDVIINVNEIKKR